MRSSRVFVPIERNGEPINEKFLDVYLKKLKRSSKLNYNRLVSATLIKYHDSPATAFNKAMHSSVNDVVSDIYRYIEDSIMSEKMLYCMNAFDTFEKCGNYLKWFNRHVSSIKAISIIPDYSQDIHIGINDVHNDVYLTVTNDLLKRPNAYEVIAKRISGNLWEVTTATPSNTFINNYHIYVE